MFLFIIQGISTNHQRSWRKSNFSSIHTLSIHKCTNGNGRETEKGREREGGVGDTGCGGVGGVHKWKEIFETYRFFSREKIKIL